VAGIANPSAVIDEIFNLANNKEKVSANLLQPNSVEISTIEGKSLIVVEVPSASRALRPVYLGQNPLHGAYKRRNTADQKCDAETVKRWISEQHQPGRDAMVLTEFDIDDLDQESIIEYRRLLADRNTDHVFLNFTGIEFLKKIRAYGTDRITQKSGLTIAGLLMFGTYQSIQDFFPYYHLDYQERPRAVTEARWVDRVTLDGTWSGNVFQFFRKVFRKLIDDLKIPFALKDGQAVAETAVHAALREALVNTLIHADYSLPASILVVRRPDMFGFRNPGLMRVPPAIAMRGGESDGRNRLLQKMFLLIGFGEQAGSGLPTIVRGWEEKHWTPPKLTQKDEPNEQTLLELRMSDLMPKQTVEHLEETFGDQFAALESNERMILATAHGEGAVTHSRLLNFVDLHSTDLSRLIHKLVQKGLLIQEGHGRGAAYHLPGVSLPRPEDIDFTNSEPAITNTMDASELAKNASELVKGSELSEQSSSDDPISDLIAGLPIIRNVAILTTSEFDTLKSIAADVRAKAKCPKREVEQAVASLCEGRFITLSVLAEILERSPDYLRQNILKGMIERGLIKRAYPQIPNDPRQAYSKA
jgi:ATP-dependent DNA helicase RecG